MTSAETSVYLVIHHVAFFSCLMTLTFDNSQRIFVDKAVELADRLLYAFETGTGIPHASVNLVT